MKIKVLERGMVVELVEDIEDGEVYNHLYRGKVVEVSEGLKEKFPKGTIIYFPIGGANNFIMDYKKYYHLIESAVYMIEEVEKE